MQTCIVIGFKHSHIRVSLYIEVEFHLIYNLNPIEIKIFNLINVFVAIP